MTESVETVTFLSAESVFVDYEELPGFVQTLEAFGNPQ
jgi:hypothetical protein